MYNEMQYKTETKTAVSNAINAYMCNYKVVQIWPGLICV